MVGNFQEWKGQHVVIEALGIIKTKYPDLECLLIGDVPKNKQDIEYFEKIKQNILDKGLKQNIIITGYRNDVPDLINSCDVMLHASIIPEPFGMVVLESMCLKKPVIATNIGGPKEIIENGLSGILIPPANSTILAEEIDFLLHNEEQRKSIGENAIKRVSNNFSFDHFSHEIDNFYHQIFS